MKPNTFNTLLSAVLVFLAVINLAFSSWDRPLHASGPQCGGVDAPSANCVCCQESQTWYCE